LRFLLFCDVKEKENSRRGAEPLSRKRTFQEEEENALLV